MVFGLHKKLKEDGGAQLLPGLKTTGQSTEETRPGDFPGSPAVKTPPSNAVGAGSNPSQGTKVPHAVGCRQKFLNQSINQ